MNEQTLVAVYDTAAHADAAVSDLKAADVPAGAISQHARNGSEPENTRTPMAAPAREPGFWGRLFGGAPEEEDAAVYDRSIDSGATVVTVRAPEERVDRISAILEQHHPIDLDERAAGYGATETTTTRTTTAPATGTRGTDAAATDGGTLRLAEESLAVGKRAVRGGTTRIRRYVVETPVEEQVTLHTEKVSLDRRPVTDGRAVGSDEFTDKTLEMTETNEEAVVSKTARVREEVRLRKDASERVETVKDTVRRDDVKVEQVPGERTDTSRTTGTAPVMPAPAAQRGAKI